MCADSKTRLLRDYTLKQEAVSLDHRAAAFGTDRKFASSCTTICIREKRSAKLIGRRANAAEYDYRDTVPLQRMSEYQEWVENTAINLNSSAKARQRSRKIVQVRSERANNQKCLFVFVFKRLINSTREFAQAMRQEAINVENTLKDSIRNWTEWRDSLAAQLKDKDKELKTAEAAVQEIQFSLGISSSPLQVALMRQNQRGLRPGIELCNDKAQHALAIELSNLKSSMLSVSALIMLSVQPLKMNKAK